jgi:hypothetical protein
LLNVDPSDDGNTTSVPTAERNILLFTHKDSSLE